MATAFTDDDDFYKMDASPKGICLIINNFKFERSRRLDTGPADKGHCLARSEATTRPVVITDKRDFLVSFATTPGNKSYCNPDSTKGAVYFYHLTRLLEHYANSKTIMHILHKLNEALTVESPAHALQTAQYESTLAKELRFYCPVQAMVRALQQELTQARSRVQVLEREVKRKDDQIKQNDTDSANQLQGEKARHQNTAKQLTDSKKTCSALEKDVASYKRQLRELQNKAHRFHDNHGKCVVLSNNHQTATFQGNFIYDGLVMSCDPMEVNKLYEVHITKTGIGWWSLCVGVVTSSPDRLTVPDTAHRGWESAVAVYRACFFDHGDKRDSDVGKALRDLRVGSFVGVSLDPSRRLHLHVNGADQGVVPCRSLPDPCWALWELDHIYPQITSLPVRDLP